MPKDFPEQIKVRSMGFPNTISETTPIVDTHEGYGWVAAPVARRLERALRQRISELEKRVKVLELRLLDFAEIHSDLYFIKHTLKTRNAKNENTIPETTKLC